MKVLLFLAASWFGIVPQTERKVCVIIERDISSIVFDNSTGNVNIHIDESLVSDPRLQEGIKLYLASFFVEDEKDLIARFSTVAGVTLQAFAQQHRRRICDVIYYLERVDHGNLPYICGRDAYRLLDVAELEPCLRSVRKKLYKGQMLLIDGIGGHGDIDKVQVD